MDKQECKICGMQFDSSRAVCPRCGVVVGTEMPSTPFTASRIILLLFCAAILAIGAIGLTGDIVFGSIILLICGIVFGSVILSGLFKDLRLWNLARNDHPAFMREIKTMYPFTNSPLSAEIRDAAYQAKEAYYSKIPACPICHTKNHVRRLSNLDRTVSTAVWGAASSAIGKQWECTSCNHKFNVDVTATSRLPVNAMSNSSASDQAVELRKYKQLLDDGLITQADYDQKKKQLLGL